MAWNNGYPATYSQYPQGYQVPVYGQQMTQAAYQQPGMQQQAAPQMTPPTIRAEIVQVDGEDAANAFPVGAGTSQMMISRDETEIYIKSATANGQTVLDVYRKRPPAPPAPKFDPAEYMRKDDAQKWITEQVETLVAAAIAAQGATRRATKADKTEVE